METDPQCMFGNPIPVILNNLNDVSYFRTTTQTQVWARREELPEEQLREICSSCKSVQVQAKCRSALRRKAGILLSESASICHLHRSRGFKTVKKACATSYMNLQCSRNECIPVWIHSIQNSQPKCTPWSFFRVPYVLLSLFKTAVQIACRI